MRSKIKANDDKNLKALFLMSNNFEIPSYQREYVWDENEQIAEMFEDLKTFSGSADTDENYYFGSIVFQSDGDKLLIVDGQQRMTSFTLFLRAVIEYLEKQDEDRLPEEAFDLKKEISDLLWNTTKGNYDRDKPKFHSKSYSDKNIEDFNSILKNGSKAQILNDKSNYIHNYRFLLKSIEDYILDNNTDWLKLPKTLVDKVQLVVLECDNFETAINVFKTLNSTGQKLSDVDIFKVKLMDVLKNNQSELDDFVRKWNEIMDKANSVPSTSAEVLFNCIMHYHKAICENSDTTDRSPREYFTNKNEGWLYAYPLKTLDILSSILDFFIVVYDNKNSGITLNDKSLSYLWLLSKLNDGWYRAPVVYFLKYRDTKEFDEKYATFLGNYTKAIFYDWILRPNQVGFKAEMYKTYVSIYKNCDDVSSFKRRYDEENLKNALALYENDKYKVQQVLLSLIASIESDFTIKIGTVFEVEHILPKSFESSYTGNWDTESHKEYLEKFGNKLPLQKIPNIKIGNSWEGTKWDEYENSPYDSPQKFVKRYPEPIWTIEKINANSKYYKNLISKWLVDKKIFE